MPDNSFRWFIRQLGMIDELAAQRLQDIGYLNRSNAELAAKGLRNSEIANTFSISENTVKHHLKIAFQKMNIDRRSKLIDMLR